MLVLVLPSRCVALAIRKIAGRCRWLVSFLAALSWQLVPVGVQGLRPLGYVHALSPFAGVPSIPSRFARRWRRLGGCLARRLATLACLTQPWLLRWGCYYHLVRFQPVFCGYKSFLFQFSKLWWNYYRSYYYIVRFRWNFFQFLNNLNNI